MTRDERNQIRRDAASNHKGDLKAAACTFLDATIEFNKAKGIPHGYEAAVGGIVWEVEHSADADAGEGSKTAGTTRAKSK